jgi:hypothetical protein
MRFELREGQEKSLLVSGELYRHRAGIRENSNAVAG